MTNFKIYLKSILLPVILGSVVGLFTSKSMNYASLNKPPFAPPGILFPIIWTILYILMGISFALLTTHGKNTDLTTKSYYLQLFVNLVWPIIFFTFKWRLFALIWIILLLILVINMIYQFFRQYKLSSYLQIPYLLWICYATYLNLFFYLLNT